jgi:hypothetical protein
MREQVTKLAQADGISANHFISLAIAEKISRLQYESTKKEQNQAYADEGSAGTLGQRSVFRFY